MKTYLAITFALLAWQGAALLHAAPGDLDRTFGTWGKVTTGFGSTDTAYSVALQSDGKIVAAGSSSGNGFAVARYNADGSLDSSFGTRGKVTTGFAGGSSGYSVAVQSDGKVVVAGQAALDFAVARYNADGSLDSSFGTGGKVTTGFGTDSVGAGYSVAVQSDGKIVVAGYHTDSNNGNYDFALVRYNSDGSLDSGFGTAGIVTTDFGGIWDSGRSVALQSDGKIVVAGYTDGSGSNHYDFALARYNADGSLDSSFGTGGKVTTSYGSFDYGWGVAVQSDGKIVVAGETRISQYSNNNYFLLLRYNADGSLDSSFGVGGTTLVSLGYYNYNASVALQSDGKIVLAGRSATSLNGTFYHWQIAVVRVNADGSLDSSFGTGGWVTTGFGNNNDSGLSVALQGDGKIVVAGCADQDADSIQTNHDFALVRYNADGTLDSGFGGGKVTTPIGRYYDDYGHSVALQNDGKIVAAGESWNGNNFDAALVRYNSDGSLDSGFGTAGIVTTDFGNTDDYGRSVALQSDGKIVVAGYADGSGSDYYDFALVRYNSDGSLDSGFGIGGKVITPVGSTNDMGYSVAVQGDGKIIVAGGSSFSIGIPSDIALVRYNADGSLDTGFGVAGKVTTDLGGTDDMGYSVAVQSDGKIVVVGDSSSGNSTDIALIRYNADGTLDTGFGAGGMVTTDFGSWNDMGYSVALQSDGKIVVAGQTAGDFALARYNADGTLDSGFGAGGKVIIDFGGTDVAYSLALQSNGKIVVAGHSSGNSSTMALVRHNADGSLDSSFGAGGKVITPVGFNNNSARGIAVQSDGRFVVAGYCGDDANNIDFALVRYLGDSPTIEIWRQTYFGTTSNSGDAADPFDFDGDGLVNLIEFAFGLDPTLGTSLQLPQPQRAGNDFVVSFTQPAGVSGISYGVEWSTTLSGNPSDWMPITDSDPSPTGYLFSVPMGANERLFMRLKVTAP